MKNSIFVILLLGLLYACNQTPTYTISGTIADNTEATIYLQQRIGGEFITIDSAAMVNGTFEGDVEETRRQLLEYCKLDTYAMVRILDKLQQV